MRSLSDHDIVRIWEVGQQQHPLDRALTMLAFAFPERSLSTLAHLTIGERDALLLMLREQVFGTTLESVASCPHCQEQLEFALNTQEIRVIDPRLPPAHPPALPSELPSELADSQTNPPHHAHQRHQCQIDDVTLHFRLPTSVDIAAITSMGPSQTTSVDLAYRCLLAAVQGGKTEDRETENVKTEDGETEKNEVGEVLGIEQLGDEKMAMFANHLAQADPQAEILLDLQCPACGYEWQMLFDIVSYFWTELSSHAKRLLIDVHQLARVYGWSEADILTMSNTRRQYYLELVA